MQNEVDDLKEQETILDLLIRNAGKRIVYSGIVITIIDKLIFIILF